MIIIAPSSDAIDAVMARAIAKPRGCGGYFAYVENAAHEASADGHDATEALANLRAMVSKKLPAVLRALRVITGKETC